MDTPPSAPPQPTFTENVPTPPPPSSTSTSPATFTPVTTTAVSSSLTNTPSSSSSLKKIVFAILALALLLGLVFALFRFFQNRNSISAPIALSYWGLWEDENTMQELISQFQSQHPNVTVNYTRQSQRDYRERLSNSLAKGEGPDIFRFHNTWAPMFRNDLAQIPDAILSSSEFASTFYPIHQKDLQLSNQYIGIPLMIDTLLLYYNEDLLASSGKTPPQTWDELLRTSLELKAAGLNSIALGNSTNVDHWQDILALLMLQNNTDLNRPGSSIGSDGKNLGADALTFFTLFSKDYQIWSDTLPSSSQSFASGKLVFYIGPSWRSFEFAKNPSLRFSTTATPKLGDTQTHYATYWAEGVSQKSAHQDIAWQFLKFLSSKESMQKLYETQSKTRLFGEPPSRLDLASNLAQTPIISSVLASAPQATSWFLASHTWDGESGLNSRLSKYFEDAVNNVLQGGDPATALQTVDQGVSQVLNQYNISSK